MKMQSLFLKRYKEFQLKFESRDFQLKFESRALNQVCGTLMCVTTRLRTHHGGPTHNIQNPESGLDPVQLSFYRLE